MRNGLHFFDAHIFQARAAGACAQREIGRLDAAVLRHQDGALDNVIQLADIALPGMLQHRIQRRAIEPADAFAIALRMRGQKMVWPAADIFAPFAQWRQMNLDGVQPEQQILAKPAALHFFI